MKQAILQT